MRGVKYLRHRIFVLGLAVVTALGTTAGVALATGKLPGIGADGRIDGCYKKNSGKLRVVREADDCRASELAIHWNVEGPAGPAGPAGPMGAAGPQGERGPQGEPGTALAYAHVRGHTLTTPAALVAAHTKNVAGMVRLPGSLYCFNLAFEPSVVSVQSEGIFGGSNIAAPSAIIPAMSSGTWACPEGYRSAAVHVQMDRSFYVLFN